MKNKSLRLVCYTLCLVLFVVWCVSRWQPKEDAKPYTGGIYYGWDSSHYGYGLQYVILTKDSIYVNVSQIRDSALVNINRWYQPYASVRLRNFVPIGIQWYDMVCFMYRDSIGNVFGKDSVYIYEHGIDYWTDLTAKKDYYLFHDPDMRFTFYKSSFENLQKEGIVPSKCNSMEDVEKYLCLNDFCVFEGIRKMSKSELRTLLWGE